MLKPGLCRTDALELMRMQPVKLPACCISAVSEGACKATYL